MTTIALRPLTDDDLDDVFAMMSDPEGVWMAAFTAEDPADRAHFDAWVARNRADPRTDNRVITSDGVFAGTIASFVMEGDTEVTYWLSRAFWGRGVASEALSLLLADVTATPLYARVAADNVGSLRVLAKAGFHEVGRETAYAPARSAQIEEVVLQRG